MVKLSNRTIDSRRHPTDIKENVVSYSVTGSPVLRILLWVGTGDRLTELHSIQMIRLYPTKLRQMMPVHRNNGRDMPTLQSVRNPYS